MSNNHLNYAKITKNDEYYTYLDDIQKELDLQRKLFFNKVIFLAFDDYLSSNFYSYFRLNFNKFKLKKLICLSKTHKIIVNKTKDEIIEVNGEFDNQEWNNCLNECNLVVSNPPFSILLDIIKKIKENNKDFLLIIPLLSVSTNLIFDMIKNNQVYFGNYSISKFYNPDNQIVSNACYWASSQPMNIVVKPKKETNIYEHYIVDDKNSNTYKGLIVYNVDKLTLLPNKDTKDKYYAVPINYLVWNNEIKKRFQIIEVIQRPNKKHLNDVCIIFKRILIKGII